MRGRDKQKLSAAVTADCSSWQGGKFKSNKMELPRDVGFVSGLSVFKITEEDESQSLEEVLISGVVTDPVTIVPFRSLELPNDHSTCETETSTAGTE